MSYLKHNSNGKRSSKPAKKPESPATVIVTGPETGEGTGRMSSPSLQHDINHVAGLAGIEASLDWLARSVERLSTGEHSISLSTGHGTDPVKVTLAPDDYEDTMGRVVTAFERIADSLAKIAGLSRPRLESWHEQDEYEPRYKDVAVDGGAPGPKREAA